MRKFRLLDSEGYGDRFIVGGVYDETVISWSKPVSILVEEFPQDWEEVFEDIEPTLEERVNELEMSYVGADTFEVLEERVKVLEGLIKKPYEESENTVECSQVLYKFVGNPVDYRWNKNPLRGNVYTKDQIASMYGSGFHTRPFNVIVRDFEIVSDEISKPEQKLLPQKYQLIEVRDSEDKEWTVRAYLREHELRGSVVCVDNYHLVEVMKSGLGDRIDDSKICPWGMWKFID